MIRSLKALYQSELMCPTVLSVFINPFYFIRKGLLDGIRKNAHYMTGVMMDFGCGESPYRKFFNVEQYVGVDIAESGHDHSSEEVDVFYDGKTLPFGNDTFDSILSTEVLEHVFHPERAIAEMSRILKPSGLLLISTPSGDAARNWENVVKPIRWARNVITGEKGRAQDLCYDKPLDLRALREYLIDNRLEIMDFATRPILPSEHMVHHNSNR